MADFQPAYTTLDAGLDLTLPDGRTMVGLFWKNITKEHFFNGMITASSGGYYIPPVPSTLFVRLGTSF
jgi:hypothetical protein